MGTPSLGTLAATDGAGLLAFCTSFCALPVGVAMLVTLELVQKFEDRRREGQLLRPQVGNYHCHGLLSRHNHRQSSWENRTRTLPTYPE